MRNSLYMYVSCLPSCSNIYPTTDHGGVTNTSPSEGLRLTQLRSRPSDARGRVGGLHSEFPESIQLLLYHLEPLKLTISFSLEESSLCLSSWKVAAASQLLLTQFSFLHSSIKTCKERQAGSLAVSLQTPHTHSRCHMPSD